MAINPLDRSIRSAFRMNDDIGKLFARIGSTAHPRGEVMSAYRTANLAMESALNGDDPLRDAQDVLRNLRRQLLLILAFLLREAIDMGEEEAVRQLDWYGEEARRRSIFLTEQINSATNAVMARFDAQDAAIIALILAGLHQSQILGGGTRAGILSAVDVTNAASFWATNLVWDAFDETIGTKRGGREFAKVAVAVLDERTTDCCLKVHGQVVPFREPFHLTGTPRFADHMDWPGFHWYCRTSVAVYEKTFDTGITAKMVRDAALIMNARKATKTAATSA